MILRAAMIITVLGTVSAQALDASVAACTRIGTGLDQVLSELEQIGWSRAAQPSDLHHEHVAWMLATTYLEADTGGLSVERILELERPMAKGLLRKKDIPTVRARLLEREIDGTAETLYLVFRQPQPGAIEVQCRFALSAASVAHYSAETDRGAFKVLDPVASSHGPVIRATGVMHPHPGAPAATIETQMSYRAEDPK